MPNKKKTTPPAKLLAQKKRTYANQVAKYQKLLDEDPSNKDTKVWRKQLEFYQNAPTK